MAKAYSRKQAATNNVTINGYVNDDGTKIELDEVTVDIKKCFENFAGQCVKVTIGVKQEEEFSLEDDIDTDE